MKSKAIIAVACILAAAVAHGQGLFVQPTSAEVSVRPGANYDIQFDLRNNQANQANNVEITTAYLTQDLGGFEGIERDKMTPELLRQFPSCTPWFKMPANLKFGMPALAQQSRTVRISVPFDARGFYGGAVVITSQRPVQTPGLNLVLRFVVPILLHVDSGIVRKSGQVVDGAASFVPESPGKTAGTQIVCLVKNTGSAITRYAGTAALYQEISGRRRRVISGTFDERRVIPNATLALNFTSPNRLPSGTYHLEADMTMEGQKLPSLSKDIIVKGDPAAKTAASDLEMSLTPDPLEFDAVPGSVRGLSFKVTNTGLDPIIVDASMATPKLMQGASGMLGTGEDFSLAQWCTQPLTGVTIRPGEERSLRMVATVPEGQLKYHSYFGELVVSAKTVTGQPVGAGSLLVIGSNRRVQPITAFNADGDVVISSVRPKIYGFTSSFTNTGSALIEPELEARITDPSGLNTMLGLTATIATKRVLPLQTFRPSGQIDVSLLKDGAYVLEIVAKSGDIGQTKTVGIRVATVNKVKTLTLIAASKTKLAPSESSKPAQKGGGR